MTLTLTITGDYIKPVTYNGQNYIVGTNSADNFDKNVIVDTIYEYVAGASKLKGLGSITNFLAGAGDDVMGGGAGNDNLWGGLGDDTLWGYAGNDIVYGEEGNDELYGQEGNDKLVGGVGDDSALGGVGQDSIWGGAGNDELQGNEGNDLLSGDVGNDVLFGQVGDDKLWGGDGDDVLVGFTGANELKQSLSSGETDNDSLYGGNGNDLIQGLLGNDILHGEAGNDELQGNEGDDYLYGGLDMDKLFGQVGNDVLYGGEGDDILVGFMAANETKKDLSTGETDNNLIYGGGGQDTLIGGLGNDYLDGGAGADEMEDGTGNDVYIVNSVNDSILEQKEGGYDTVISSTNYQLNYGIEELRLLRILDPKLPSINATGNAFNNLLIGNNQNNIIDGVTGKDTMIGGTGDDTYYIDDIDDRIEEYAKEGTDKVQASISYTLGGNLENLVLLDFSKPEEGKVTVNDKGMLKNIDILVYGYPKRYELDYMQGNADPDYQGTCALTSIANVLVQSGKTATEADVINRATSNVTGETWAVTTGSASEKGGSTPDQQQKLLDSFGLDNDILSGYNEQAIANLIMGGRGVVIAVDSDVLWTAKPTATAGSVVDHVVTVTGVAFDKTTGALSGFFIADSGRKLVTDMNRYLDLDAFKAVANVKDAYSIYTIKPIKFWEENINATGNELANNLVGNRGDNLISGLTGDDVLQGLAGNDTLKGGLGADVLTGGLGNDTLYAVDGTLTDTSVDTFIYNFTQNEGYDQIIGFNATQDKIKIESGINFSTSVSSINMVNNDTLITLKNGTSINVVGIKTGIDSTDFSFS